MNIQAQLDSFLNAKRKASFKETPQITLGELIKLIEQAGKEDSEIVFDFGYFYPGYLYSWRGSYSELALEYSNARTDTDKPMTKPQFLELLKGAIGKEYTGYKGGEFIMDESTPIWVALWGESNNTGVVGVKDLGYEIVILTSYCDY